MWGGKICEIQIILARFGGSCFNPSTQIEAEAGGLLVSLRVVWATGCGLVLKQQNTSLFVILLNMSLVKIRPSLSFNFLFSPFLLSLIQQR